jgi:mono/diheme cytochrome c family protein
MGAATRLWLTLLLALPLVSTAAELTVQRAGATQRYTSEQLAARGQRVVIRADVAYGRSMHYVALPLDALLPALHADDHLQLMASDGFTADIPASMVVDGHGARAWLAVEPASAPWPAIAPGKPGAGPFYLVWTHPEQAHVGREQWPFQITMIRVTTGVSGRFPAMQPGTDIPAHSPVRRGLAQFQRNCLSCHALNGQGDATMGPDLNIPHSAVDYLGPGLLKVLVRNPQALRHWPRANMPAFGTDVLSYDDLNDLVAYLSYMAAHKAAAAH